MAVEEPAFRLYVDEVGNSSTKDISDKGRYLSLSGVILRRGAVWRRLDAQLEEFKRVHFPFHSDENPVVLHRQKMVVARKPFLCLKRKAKKNRVWGDLLDIIRQTPFKVVTVGIDKKTHVERHGPRAWDPYDFCMMTLVERYILFLQGESSVGDVMVEARTPWADQRLASSFKRAYAMGSSFLNKGTYIQRLTSAELKIKSKRENEPGLQLVDQLAAPSDKMLRARNGIAVDDGKDLDRAIVRILRDEKYRRSRTGRVDGYGLVWIV